MSELKIKGAIKLINEIKVVSDKFSVQEFVISVQDGKYTQDIIFSLVNDRMDLIKPYGIGQEVEVSFNLRGREFNGRYYNTLDAWKVQGEKKEVPPVTTILDEQDDLPF